MSSRRKGFGRRPGLRAAFRRSNREPNRIRRGTSSAARTATSARRRRQRPALQRQSNTRSKAPTSSVRRSRRRRGRPDGPPWRARSRNCERRTSRAARVLNQNDPLQRRLQSLEQTRVMIDHHNDLARRQGLALDGLHRLQKIVPALLGVRAYDHRSVQHRAPSSFNHAEHRRTNCQAGVRARDARVAGDVRPLSKESSLSPLVSGPTLRRASAKRSLSLELSANLTAHADVKPAFCTARLTAFV